jgi:hypothetical protein
LLVLAVGICGGLRANAQGTSGTDTTLPWQMTGPPAARSAAPPVSNTQFFKTYGSSAPITKWPLKKVLHQIPDLKRLKPVTGQSQLVAVLRGVSANLQKFIVGFVDTTALETVDEAEDAPQWSGAAAAGLPPVTKRATQKFRYLMLARREGSAFSLVEYRTDLRGREEHSQIQTGGFIKTTGFAAMPLFFGPLQQPWSDFRYLGQQMIGGTNTEVAAFAEHVDPAAVMGHLLIADASVPLLVQGVAWIRAADYQVLQMRTDLLAPLPLLREVTTLVLFAENQFEDSPTALWLPKEVTVKVELGDYVFSNRHRYSDYRRFRVSSVIKAESSDDQQH